MEVVTNYFDQITPSGNCQFHNTMILSKDAANVVVFNNMAYPCRWGQTADYDGQWQQITVSFVRHQRDEWPVEHYVRIGYDTFILQYRRPATPCHRPSEDGTFYDVPLKILRVLSFSRCAYEDPTPPGPRDYYLQCGHDAATFGHYLQIAYNAPMVANGETIVPMIMDNIAPPTKDKEEEQQEYVVVESTIPQSAFVES